MVEGRKFQSKLQSWNGDGAKKGHSQTTNEDPTRHAEGFKWIVTVVAHENGLQYVKQEKNIQGVYKQN